MARGLGDLRTDLKDSAMMVVQHMLDHIFLCHSSQQLMSDSCHDNLCSVTLSETTPISVSWCLHTCAKQIKKSICILEGGEEGEENTCVKVCVVL